MGGHGSFLPDSAKALAPEMDTFRGFLVHAYADPRRNRLYFTGRLEDGRSFAAMETRWRPSFHISTADLSRIQTPLTALGGAFCPPALKPFGGGEALTRVRFSRFDQRAAALNILAGAGVSSPDGDMKPAEAFLAERSIRLALEIRGAFRPGRLVDLVFPDPELQAAEGTGAALRIASIDIETDTRTNVIRAVSSVFTDSRFAAYHGAVRVLLPPGAGDRSAPERSAAETGAVAFHRDEASLLRGFIRDIQEGDPDALTGWNFLDFDFPRLADRCERLGIPFTLGRSQDSAKFFAAEGNAPGRALKRRSAAALVPGRQVIDALRIVRSGPRRFSYEGTDEGQSARWGNYSLQTVAEAVLGEGKTVTAEGEDKIARLDQLFYEDPLSFGRYCYRDALLVLKIFAKTGLFRLTMERAGLTGVFLDKAWTSVVSFERIYGMELRKRGIAPGLPPPPELKVSGAAGGTVLEPASGVFNNIAVFDFRSLYPTIMLTFNIDPLAHARAHAAAERIQAPNGAAFSRTPGPLPELIEGYFAARRKALDGGDENAAYVYKILMNSFYGVLGTASCRYGRTELAGAITSFARKWLLASRDWFTARGRRVLYGDTDSLFVETGLDDRAAYAGFAALSEGLAAELNRFLAEEVRREYGLESRLELRFEKAYRRFMIPPLRGLGGGDESRGRAKGYAGSLILSGGGTSVEVKGMEAVRSDTTPLARRLQLELLELVFSEKGEAALRDRVIESIEDLRKGKLDGELVYRKRLTRPPEAYTSSTPPQVKAARALGWKGRRGVVEFVWTEAGPEPASMPHAPYDYDHYANSQVLPVAGSIAAAAGWDTDIFLQKGRSRKSQRAAWENGQLEFDWQL
ncbi:MAG: DNA polymerase II [Treponema sp.]|jgi:DNA polymerase-2|nr:DNA polymerase II [Treponema sp.]